MVSHGFKVVQDFVHPQYAHGCTLTGTDVDPPDKFYTFASCTLPPNKLFVLPGCQTSHKILRQQNANSKPTQKWQSIDVISILELSGTFKPPQPALPPYPPPPHNTNQTHVRPLSAGSILIATGGVVQIYASFLCIIVNAGS